LRPYPLVQKSTEKFTAVERFAESENWKRWMKNTNDLIKQNVVFDEAYICQMVMTATTPAGPKTFKKIHT